MMALSDIVMANDGLREWTVNPKMLDRQQGGRLYYGRMVMSQVFEALETIKEIQKNNNLKRVVENCDPET